MKRFAFALLAAGLALAPVSSVVAQDLHVGPHGVRVSIGHDRDHRDHHHDCRVVVTKIHHHGTTVVKRQRKCG